MQKIFQVRNIVNLTIIILLLSVHYNVLPVFSRNHFDLFKRFLSDKSGMSAITSF